MKELLITTWCDYCASESPDEPHQTQGETHLVALDGPPREVDVCELHWKSLSVLELATLVQEVGRAPEMPATGRRATPAAAHSTVAGLVAHQRKGKRPQGPRPYLCAWCPMNYASSQAVLDHARKVHGIKAGKAHELFNGQCPLCGHATQLLNDHCVKEHEGSWGEVYRLALAAGDPTGLVTPLERSARDVHR